MSSSNQPIVRMQFGSHIYGTNVPESDRDFKSVFIPDPKDLILQRAAKHIESNTKKNEREKNTAFDIDDEAFSVSEYIRLLCESQTVALDMLFTPKCWVIAERSQWRLIQKNREKFLHRGVGAFFHYAKAQAAKYGVKGFRVAALRQTLDFLQGFVECERLMKLNQHENEVRFFVTTIKNEHINIVRLKGANGLEEDYLEVCNRKIPFHASIQYARECLQRVFDEYGHRALLAERNEGVDWKALMHAVRVAREAEELLLTGNITFPRPELELLLKIRKQELPYKDVALMIEDGLQRIESAKEKSTLPDHPDREYASNLIYEFHKTTINFHLTLESGRE